MSPAYRSHRSFAGKRTVISTALILLALLVRVVPDWLPRLEGRVPAAFIALWLAVDLLIVAVLLLNRGHLGDLYITRRELRPALVAGLLAWPVILGLALLYALHRLGGFHWMPLAEYPETLAGAIFFALPEELLFRSFLLSRLVRWNVRPWLANLVQALLFTLAHPRYLLRVPGYTGHTQPDLWLVLLVFLVAWATGLVALRYRNVWGAVVLHVGFDFLMFVPIAGVLGSL